MAFQNQDSAIDSNDTSLSWPDAPWFDQYNSLSYDFDDYELLAGLPVDQILPEFTLPSPVSDYSSMNMDGLLESRDDVWDILNESRHLHDDPFTPAATPSKKNCSTDATHSPSLDSCLGTNSSPTVKAEKTSKSLTEKSRKQDSKKARGKYARSKRQNEHNLIEKRYRNNLNSKINTLRNNIPCLSSIKEKECGNDGMESDDSDGTRLQKCNKGIVFDKAVEYIAELRSQVLALSKENERFRLAHINYAYGQEQSITAMLTMFCFFEEKPCLLDTEASSTSQILTCTPIFMADILHPPAEIPPNKSATQQSWRTRDSPDLTRSLTNYQNGLHSVSQNAPTTGHYVENMSNGGLQVDARGNDQFKIEQPFAAPLPTQKSTTLCGLRERTIWMILVACVLLVIGGVTGGVVAGLRRRSSNKSAISATTVTTTVSAGSATQTNPAIPTSSSSPFDSNVWYRLTNEDPGTSIALDVVNDNDIASSGRLQMQTPKAVSGQYWQIRQLADGKSYALCTQFLGPNMRLDVSEITPHLAPSSTSLGQQWFITAWGAGTWRVANAVKGAGFYLDSRGSGVVLYMNDGSLPGQRWKFEALGPINNSSYTL
ncbi:HLH, helix-loop-helix DNA-binding protein [Glarea lozoyensis ATCC 20868]|uniref:HLH, helix-loop-helix DNA-binding protein n=1 Tax=Glarea lozoyensis (strain ATCC 20868 / MF5171) TaxID=1116229 RepID=S3D5U1_GLAL2|nr:HLH, helix-loop-helix DNA-binding protein [Glarea lozoyensis ATCC 20868]EPE33130.1 HLH, helix-loop-helix DNA-binding protein [Glarea lozoyensis ATCC 20868]